MYWKNVTIVRAHWPAVLYVVVLACGCTTTFDHRYSRDIVAIATFPDKRNPWLNFDDPPRDVPGGIKFPVYLNTPRSPMGVFGDGTIHVDMYRIDHEAEDREQPVHLKRWTFSNDEAYLYGFREKQRVGWGYQLRLNWGDVDVLGREVMFLVSFERHDGLLIRGKRMYFKVPHKV